MITPTISGKLRNEDPTGNGWYGAKRGLIKHKGVDYLCEPLECIYACISGKVRIGNVYVSNSKFKLIEITNSQYRVKQMYVSNGTVKNGDIVRAGDLICYSQNISAYHGRGMKNHVHVSLWKNGLLTDPEPVLKPWKNV